MDCFSKAKLKSKTIFRENQCGQLNPYNLWLSVPLCFLKTLSSLIYTESQAVYDSAISLALQVVQSADHATMTA